MSRINKSASYRTRADNSLHRVVEAVDNRRPEHNGKYRLHKPLDVRGNKSTSTSRLPIMTDRPHIHPASIDDCECTCHHSGTHQSPRCRATLPQRSHALPLSSMDYIGDNPFRWDYDSDVVNGSGENMELYLPEYNDPTFANTYLPLPRDNCAQNTMKLSEQDINENECDVNIDKNDNPVNIDEDGSHAQKKCRASRSSVAVQTDSSASDSQIDAGIQVAPAFAPNSCENGAQTETAENCTSVKQPLNLKTILLAIGLGLVVYLTVNFQHCLVTTRYNPSVTEVLIERFLETAGHTDHLAAVAWEDFFDKLSMCSNSAFRGPLPITAVFDYLKTFL